MRKTILASVFIILAPMFLVGVTTSAPYDPWADLDGDGDIDIYDIVEMADRYGSSGEPFVARAAIEYDSGWVDITDKAGQFFSLTHNLNSTDLIVDISGKASFHRGVHKRHLGGTGHSLHACMYET